MGSKDKGKDSGSRIVARMFLMMLLFVSVFFISTSIVSAACVKPAEDTIISKSTTLCQGKYYLKDLDNDMEGLISITTPNVLLNCDGASIIGSETITERYISNTASISQGITSQVEANNVKISNCNLEQYYKGISLSGHNLTIENNNIKQTTNNAIIAGSYSTGGINIIRNNTITHPQNAHALYIWRSTAQGFDIYGNTITETPNEAEAGCAIHMNDNNNTKNIKIHDNTFRNNTCEISMYSGISALIYNNNFYDTYQYGFIMEFKSDYPSTTAIHAKNNQFYNNKIYNTKPVQYYFQYSINNTIRDNKYYNTPNIKFIVQKDKNSFTVKENTTATIDIQIKYLNANIQFNYTGLKEFNYNDKTIEITNLKAPYNDIKDLGTEKILASNVNAYSITLASGQKIEIGNFVTDTVIPIHLPPIVTVLLSSADNTVNSDLRCNYTVTGRNNVTVNTTIAWYKNGALAINNGLVVLAKKNLTVGDRWYCRVTAKDVYNSTVLNSNTITIISPVVPPSNTRLPPVVTADLSSADRTVNSDLRCNYTVTGRNNVTVNTRISWYKNNAEAIYNGQAILARKNLTVGDVWHCRVTATDTYNITIKNSNQITIVSTVTPPSNTRLPPLVTAELSSADNTVNSDLYCDYTVTGRNGITVSTRIAWYKNNAEAIYRGQATLAKTNLSVGDVWHCRVTATDTYNITIKNSNQITITAPAAPPAPDEEPEEKKRKGGGGGSSSYIPPAVIVDETLDDTENVTNTTSGVDYIISNGKVIEVSKQINDTSSNSSNVSNIPILQSTNSPHVPEQVASADLDEPAMEEKSSDGVNSAVAWTLGLLVFLSIGSLFIFKISSTKVNTEPTIIEFIEKALYVGYDYAAIKSALKKCFPSTTVNHHLKIVQMHKVQPHVRFRSPIPKNSGSYNRETVFKLKEYVKNQRIMGFRDKDIKQMLMRYGYHTTIVEAAHDD